MRGFFGARIAGASFVGVVTAMAVASTPALAARPHAAKLHGAARTRGAGRPATGLHPLASGTPQSATYGGYIVAPAEGITTVSSTFKLPAKVTCTDPDSGYVLLGEDVLASAGGDDAWAQVALGCNANGAITVGAPGGSIVNAAANLGDKIETRIVETPSGATIATVDDLTTGEQTSTDGTTNASDSQVVLGAEAYDSGDGTIEKFSQVSFTGVKVGGLDWNQTSPAPNPFALDVNGAGAQLVPSKVPAKPTSTFTLTEKKTS